MTIKEIEKQLKTAENADILQDGTSEWWDLLPRIPFPELPERYKKEVRKRFTVEDVHAFLIECYTPADFEKTVLQMTEEQKNILPFPPEEYISFVTVTKDIPANTLKKLIIKARNSAIYTIEAKDEPRLYGNHAREAFERILDEYEKSSGIQPAGKKSRRTIQKDNPKAEELSKLVSAGYYQINISDKKYRFALTPKRNNTAYILLIEPQAFEGLPLENGFVQLNDENMERFTNNIRGKYEDIKEIDLPLLVQFYTAAVKSAQSSDDYTITVYQPQFFKEMGIDTHGSKSADIMKKIAVFQNLWGYLGAYNSLGQVFALIYIDGQKQTMTFAVPYMKKIIQILDAKNHIERQTKKKELISYTKPYHNMLCHSTLASERNKAAVELVYLLTSGLLARGYIPDGETYHKKKASNADIITYDQTFRALINNAPLLKAKIDNIGSVTNKNKALKNAFLKAYELIDTQTDAPLFFCDLQYNKDIPKITTLDRVITFTHTGRNGNYHPRS